MVRVSDLLGSAPVAHFECMYTKHKTQKRKTWQDGFVSVYASRRLVLHEDGPLQGSLLGETKMTPVDFHKDLEFIDFAKFIVDIIDTTPIKVEADAAPAPVAPSFATARPSSAPSSRTDAATGGLGGAKPSSAINGKFKTPAMRPGPARLTKSAAPRGRPHPYAASNANGAPKRPLQPSGVSGQQKEDPRFDFDRHPTSEWSYKPGAVARSPDQVLALIDQQQ